MQPRSFAQKLRQVGLWIIAVLALSISLAAAWAWSNRYDLIERQAITYFDSLGIEADLDIRNATRTQADIRDISLSHNGEPFLRVERLQAAYQWRELLNGQVERLDFFGLDARIEVDATGKIIDGWMPRSSGEGGSSLPPRGIGISDAQIELTTPYGRLPLSIEAEIARPEVFSINGELSRTDLTLDETVVTVEGPFSLARDFGALEMSLPNSPLSVVHPSGDLSESVLSAVGSIKLPEQSITGKLSLNGGAFEAPEQAAASLNTLVFTGRLADGRLVGELDLDLREARLLNLDRRTDLAKTLSLSDALSNVPVAQNFAPQLAAPIRQLLLESDASLRLNVDVSNSDRIVTLRSPAVFQANSGPKAVISPVAITPLYSFDANEADAYELAFDATLSKPIPLAIGALRVRIRSDDGVQPLGVERASGTLSTRSDWSARTANGRSARLAPLNVEFDYVGARERDMKSSPARIDLRGGALYDGDIPGGYVFGMNAQGDLSAQFSERRTRVEFTPSGPLNISRLETLSDWIIEDFTARIRPGTPLYERRGQTTDSIIVTALHDATLRAIRPASEDSDFAELDLHIEQADLRGRVGTRTQDWTAAFAGLALQSKTFPVENTDLVLPDGELRVGLSDRERSTFSLSTPSSRLITPLYEMQGFAIDASGTAERYEITFEGGRVRIIPQTQESLAFPLLPVSGTAVFENGAFTGRARTILPQVPNSPVSVEFQLQDGVGQADVSISDLTFEPRGLQPQDLVPTLQGKVARVQGAVDAQLSVTFGGDTPLDGSGIVVIRDMSLSTAPGTVSGLSGTVELTSLFPVLTAPGQTLRIADFNPGFPLANGSLTYALIETGVDIATAEFPLGDGRVAFEPFIWSYGADENRVILRVSGVDVGEFLTDTGAGRFSMTGVLEGRLPVVVRGLDVLVEQGRLEVQNGGVIRFRDPSLLDRFPNEQSAAALKALEDFRYESLFLEINGPLDGDVLLGAEFTGANKDVLYGVPFQFDVTMEGELFNIARNLNPATLQRRIAASVVDGTTAAPK